MNGKAHGNVPLLSLTRFGPGTIILIAFIATTAVALYMSGLQYFAIITGIVGTSLFGVKSMEVIESSHPKDRKIVGEMCFIVKRVGKGTAGIVRICYSDGKLDPELWSAESNQEIRVGHKAKVSGIRSIILLIEPIDDRNIADEIH